MVNAYVADTYVLAFDFCRLRLHRATWTSTELFLTFPPPTLTAIALLPLKSNETAGRFRVWLYLSDESPILLWDRKVEGGFPELKVLVRIEFVLVRYIQILRKYRNNGFGIMSSQECL